MLKLYFSINNKININLYFDIIETHFISVYKNNQMYLKINIICLNIYYLLLNACVM